MLSLLHYSVLRFFDFSSKQLTHTYYIIQLYFLFLTLTRTTHLIYYSDFLILTPRRLQPVITFFSSTLLVLKPLTQTTHTFDTYIILYQFWFWKPTLYTHISYYSMILFWVWHNTARFFTPSLREAAIKFSS